MNKFRIFAAGSGLLFLLELGYSIALQRYELPTSPHRFFQGPITATITDLFAEDRHGALAVPEVKLDAKTTDLTPGALYKLLSDEFRARRTGPCQCRMPLPFMIERADAGSPNWRVGTPTRCSNGCEAIIAEVVSALGRLYDLHDPMQNPDRPSEPRTKARREDAR